MLHLEDINETNWRASFALEVSENQKNYVSDSGKLLARAYAYRGKRSRAFLIVHGEIPVGMGLYYDEPELETYDFSQIFIDVSYQGLGYGQEAVRLVLDEMKKDERYKKVILCYIEGNDIARKLYEKFGFVETDRDEDEIIMELQLI